jgi:hypothetical protein
MFRKCAPVRTPQRRIPGRNFLHPGGFEINFPTIRRALYPARGGITAPIASATGVDQLNELMKSTELKLDPSAIDLLNRASA